MNFNLKNMFRKNSEACRDLLNAGSALSMIMACGLLILAGDSPRHVRQLADTLVPLSHHHQNSVKVDTDRASRAILFLLALEGAVAGIGMGLAAKDMTRSLSTPTPDIR